jgi:anti-sigma factor RsiW
VDCEQAIALISADLDRELAADDRPILDAHLAGCADCRATAEAFRLQHADLHHAFAPRRRAAVAVGERVVAQLPTRSRVRGRVRRWTLSLMAAAALLGAVFLLYWVPRKHTPLVEPDSRQTAEAIALDQLTPRPRPAAPAAEALAIGAMAQTGTGERKRYALADGSVLYVNQNSMVKVDAERQVTLVGGEVFVEVAPRSPDEQGATFFVRTPRREVTALGTKFDVRATDGAGDVIVTQGKVKVSGYNGVVEAGQQLALDSAQLASAPRLSHALDWTRELMEAAESPLVPCSQYTGGALVAVDPYGQETKLSLRKYHIDVHMEDGFARTTIDQTYFNQTPIRMEGTFYFPLPPDASLSRLAMYVDGDLMEGGMAERDYARQVYENIVRSQRDPALLEWVDGSTFKMRVFPLEGRQEKRIILSYTQKLPALYGLTRYRFPAGHTLALGRDWRFHARIKNGAALRWNCDTHTLRATTEGSDLVLDAGENNTKVDRDVALELSDPAFAGPMNEAARFSLAEQDGERYLMLRYRPVLPGNMERQRRDWVFLFESSGDRDPLVARTQVEVIRALLTNAEHDDTFVLLTAGTRVQRFAPEPVTASPANVQAALAFLDQTHLVGALDLGHALAEAEPYLQTAQNPWLVHVGGGLPGMGEHREDVLVKRVPERTRYVGVGVGKHWARSLMKAAAERTGGYFTQINPDEPISWRGFELFATLNTPRLLDVKVVDNAEKAIFLNHTSSVAQGEELCAITRVDGTATLPESLTITGTLDGQPYRHEVRVDKVAAHADYLPRTWAKLEIDRLLAADPTANKQRIVALSKAMYVMTPYTSLLVLENEEMYRNFNVDRGRKDHWAMYPCPDKIPVVYEPDPAHPVDPRFAPKGTKPSANEILQTILVRVPPRLLSGPGQTAQANSPVVTALQVYTGAYAFVDRLGRNLERGAERLVERLDDSAPELFFGDFLGVEEDRKSERWKEFAPTQLRGYRFDEGKEQVGKKGGLIQPLRERERVEVELRRYKAESVPKLHYRQTLLLGNEATQEALLVKLVADRLPAQYGAPWDRSHALPALVADGSIRSLGFGFDSYSNLALSTTDGDLPLSPPSEFGFGRTIAGKFATGRSPTASLPSLRAAQGPQLFGRPSFAGDERLFSDLVAHAPGMNTSRADIQAVLEAEAAPDLASLPGRIDDAARRLIEQARTSGWQALSLPGGDNHPGLKFHFDGSGRYAYERTLPLGLCEIVVCDSKTLLHLYPELGIGARRAISRFHRAELTEIVPWLLPPVDDLAHGTDVVSVDEQTVALIPKDAATAKDARGEPIPYVRVHLSFAGGRLTERRFIRMPDNKTVLRETYDTNGTVHLHDADDKVLSERKLTLSPADQPDLHPDTNKLVVLPLPLRSRDRVYHSFQLQANSALNFDQVACLQYLEPEKALALFAAEVAAQDSSRAWLVYHHHFQANGDQRLGFYTLLAASGFPLNNDPEFLHTLHKQADQPLAGYLALLGYPHYARLQRWANLDWGLSLPGGDSFLRRLADFRDRFLIWKSNDAGQHTWEWRQMEQQRALAFVRRQRSSALGLAMLLEVQRQAIYDTPDHQLEMAAAWQLYADMPGIRYLARYEQARALYHGGQGEESRNRFEELYNQAFEEGVLPALDSSFRVVLQSDGKNTDHWSALMRQTAAKLVNEKRRPAAVLLAWQCWQLDDQPLALNLLTVALDGVGEEERFSATLAAVEYLGRTNQFAQADSLLQTLLDNPTFAAEASLWRLGAQIADQRGMKDRAIVCLERALDLEFKQLPEVIDLQTVRADYGKLLQHYQSVARAAVTLHVAPPPDLLAKTIRAADRWRSLDASGGACDPTAQVLMALGTRDLAWEYLTTPLGESAKDPQPWIGLAQRLSRDGELALADRALATASETAPANPQILWDRAQNLEQAGRPAEARQLLHQIADGDWSANWQWMREQARWQLGKP